MVQETAIPPVIDGLTGTASEINEKSSGEVKAKQDDRGKEVAALKNNRGWIQIEDYINQRIEDLRDFDITDLGITDMGYRYALSRGIRTELEYILSIVEANYEHQTEQKAEGTQEDN